MVLKLFITVTIFATISYAAPQADNYNLELDPYHTYHDTQPAYQREDNRHKNDNYEFGYEVNDQHTGDVKSHVESKKDGVVHGRYEVLDPDGYKRIVEYTADAIHGFNAVVRRIPVNNYRVQAFVNNVPVYSTPTPIVHAPAIHAPILQSTLAPPRRYYQTVSTTATPAYHSATHLPQSAYFVSSHSSPSASLQVPLYHRPTGFSHNNQYYQ